MRNVVITHQPPLAPGSGESAAQDGRAHVQGHSWNCAVIPESTGSCGRSALSTFPPLCSDQSSAGTVREAVYRRRPGLPGHRTHHLEQPTGQRDICPVSVNLPSAFNKKLSYRRGTARCVVSVEILPIATQQCRNYLYDKS